MIRTSLRVLVVAGVHAEMREFSVCSLVHGPFTRRSGSGGPPEADRVVAVVFTNRQSRSR